ncbi:alpha/beta fold hydrolase [Thalassospira sp. NFXS8]|uniref:alpha/beta hydrolase n=1 Tax=Thalassospira sp. NFXS8 TaxID=2819093 RepID=UPI0032DFB273
MRLAHIFLLVIALWGLAACSTVPQRDALRDQLVAKAGWSSGVVPSGEFDIAASWKNTGQSQTLFVYLEGDGLAYITPNRASTNPTPDNPVALRMAIADPHQGPVLYLARPCQYVMPDHGRNCARPYWTVKRYAPEIVASLNTALNLFKNKLGTRKLVIVGYSGGGALATLLAAQRNDIAGIVTVAANLDTRYWTDRAGVSSLTGSLDPADFAARLGNLPQVHFSGVEDTTVGPAVTRAFMAKLPANTPVSHIEVPRFDHFCCWAQNWQQLSIRPELKTIPGW